MKGHSEGLFYSDEIHAVDRALSHLNIDLHKL